MKFLMQWFGMTALLTPASLCVSLKVAKAWHLSPGGRRQTLARQAEADLDRAREPFLAEAVREVDAIVPPGSNFS